MQTGDSEQVKRAGLLKWFFDVLRRLMPEPEHDSAEKALHFGCVLQSTANRVLHPVARLLRQPQDRIPTTVSNERSILGITNKQQPTNVATRQVRAHVEFAGISWRCDRLGRSSKFQFIAKFRHTAPTDLPYRTRRFFSGFEFD